MTISSMERLARTRAQERREREALLAQLWGPSEISGQADAADTAVIRRAIEASTAPTVTVDTPPDTPPVPQETSAPHHNVVFDGTARPPGMAVWGTISMAFIFVAIAVAYWASSLRL